MSKQVIIEITGGVAELIQKPKGVSVKIIDNDNPSEEVWPEDIEAGAV